MPPSIQTLFSTDEKKPKNILPHSGEAIYHGPVMDMGPANQWFQQLLTDIDWQPDQAIIFGKKYTTARKVAWYAELPMTYTYSGVTKKALPWHPILEALKQLATQHTGAKYNSCLLNLYHEGKEGMAWHSDGEKELTPLASIASFSFGAERKFSFKHKKTGERVDQWLEQGSLLDMRGETQLHWLHRLPPTTKVNGPRINLTFRLLMDKNKNPNL